jgi:hypothetical protein
MFNVFSQTGVPGFRVRAEDDVPGFNVDENGLPQRDDTSSDGTSLSPSSTSPQQVTPVNCTTVNGSLDCLSPGGVSFSGVKASPGFPERLDSNTEDKHAYSVPDGPYQDSARTMRQDVINLPTPGPATLVRPATPEGTLNEATPEWLYNLMTTPLPMGSLGSRPIVPYGKMISPVRSYLTTDQNGRQIVVNVTEPGHPLHPGYVVRYVTPSDGGPTIQNEGEGAGFLQGSLSQLTPLAGLINSAWKDLYRDHLDRSR